MATPKGIPAVSTPKNALTSTPNRPTASPRPNAGAFANKTLSYKSPAVKTPASLHGHSHRVSISSQPNSTPLAAPAIHDELLNLNSPAAALIASIGNTGLTPIATGQDGLGITTGITPHSNREIPAPSRNPETDRVNRLDQVTKLLKTKSAGRGTTRAGVERVARINGFTIFWDEDNLTVAGNSVDLEIIFDAIEQDVIRDVLLKLNTSSSEEPVLQKNASDILKRHLITAREDLPAGEVWNNLDRLAQDLEYLGQLDHTESSTNCFELMSSLYTTFRKIWDEEKKRMQDRAEAYHICFGNVGRPLMDDEDCLGITTQFWMDRQAYEVSINNANGEPTERSSIWTARFACEKGNPGISVGHDWLDSETLKSAVTTEDVFQESQVEKPNWSSAGLTKSIDEQQKEVDAMILDGPQSGSSDTLNLVFTCHFDTAVLIPINVANELNNQFPMLQMDQSRALTYQNALMDAAKVSVTQERQPSTRWVKPVSVFDNTGQVRVKEHSYSLFANGVPWSYPVSDLQFSHPKQYADALPILRQYALLWSILRNTLVTNVKPEPVAMKLVETSSPTTRPVKHTTKRRSNKTRAQDDLEAILSSEKEGGSSLRIDLSLDLLTDSSKAKLEVIIPVRDETNGRQSSQFVQVVIEIGRNGLIDLPVLRGPKVLNEEKIKRKATKVLGLSEDLSVLIEWLLDLLQTTR